MLVEPSLDLNEFRSNFINKHYRKTNVSEISCKFLSSGLARKNKTKTKQRNKAMISLIIWFMPLWDIFQIFTVG